MGGVQQLAIIALAGNLFLSAHHQQDRALPTMLRKGLQNLPGLYVPVLLLI